MWCHVVDDIGLQRVNSRLGCEMKRSVFNNENKSLLNNNGLSTLAHVSHFFELNSWYGPNPHVPIIHHLTLITLTMTRLRGLSYNNNLRLLLLDFRGVVTERPIFAVSTRNNAYNQSFFVKLCSYSRVLFCMRTRGCRS